METNKDKKKSCLVVSLKRKHRYTWNKQYELNCVKQSMKQDFIDYLLREGLVTLTVSQEGDDVVSIEMKAIFYKDEKKDSKEV